MCFYGFTVHSMKNKNWNQNCIRVLLAIFYKLVRSINDSNHLNWAIFIKWVAKLYKKIYLMFKFNFHLPKPLLKHIWRYTIFKRIRYPLGCPKRGNNFKHLKFLSPTTNSCYLGQKHSRNVKIIKKYWYLDMPLSDQSFTI